MDAITNERLAELIEVAEKHLADSEHAGYPPFTTAGLDLIRDRISALRELSQRRSKDEGDARDAQRYRWLRYGDNDELVLRIFGLTDGEPSRPFELGRDNCYLPRDARLDHAIDSAMKDPT